MIVECLVIVILILAMSVIMLRRSAPMHGVAVLPLALVPFGYILSGPAARWLDGIFPTVSYDWFRIAVTLIALGLACLLFGLLAGNMGGKAARRAYLFLCGGFSVGLTIVLINAIRPF